MNIELGDKSAAEAIRIANKKLNASGWKYTTSDIGSMAAEIIIAMKDKISKY